MNDKRRVPVAPFTWTCGHQAMAVCAQCHAELIQRANALAEENQRLRDALDARDPV